jgi:hypothetical protein
MQASSLISRFWQYLLAILIVAGVTAIFYILRDVLLDTTLVALLYLIPWESSQLIGGLDPVLPPH